MKQYEVTGMSCAACSARVEKAVSKVPGVTSCSVSLLTNSMGVEGTATDQEIVNAVVAAGYGAAPKGAKKEQTAAEEEEALKDHETPKLRKRLIASVIFLVVLMYFSMGHMMWGWPVVPGCHERQSCGNGNVADAFNHHHHGDQPEVLCERFYQPAPRRTKYGYTGGTRRRSIVWIQYVCPVCHDRSAGARRYGRGHGLHA